MKSKKISENFSSHVGDRLRQVVHECGGEWLQPMNLMEIFSETLERMGRNYGIKYYYNCEKVICRNGEFCEIPGKNYFFCDFLVAMCFFSSGK